MIHIWFHNGIDCETVVWQRALGMELANGNATERVGPQVKMLVSIYDTPLTVRFGTALTPSCLSQTILPG